MNQKLFFQFLLFLLLTLVSCSNQESNLLMNDTEQHNLPIGYTLDSYSIEEVSNVLCSVDSDCKTPVEYLVQSRCPFTSLCINETCVVVCPQPK
jgi:hypothetical protein